MAHFFNRKNEKTLRKNLRNHLTKAEVILWSKLKNYQVNNCKFRRQFSIGPFVVDFYCPDLKLAIELDGGSHYASEEAEKKDRERQGYIELIGIKFLRFLNNDVYENLNEVMNIIYESTSPSPSLKRRGLKNKYAFKKGGD